MDNKKIVKETYSSISKQYFDKFFHTIEDEEYYVMFKKIVACGRILDLGCGNGQATAWLTENGFECVGYDFSEDMIKLGLEVNPNLNLNIGDITEVPLHEKKFDGAIYAFSFFHLTKRQALSSLISLKRNLKENANIMLILQYGNEEKFLPEPFNPELKMYICLYNEEEIDKLLNNAGYKITSITRKEYKLENSLGDDIMVVFAKPQ